MKNKTMQNKTKTDPITSTTQKKKRSNILAKRLYQVHQKGENSSHEKKTLISQRSTSTLSNN